MNARLGLLVLLTLLLPLGALAQDAPVAVLMARQGDVTVMRGSDAVAGAFGMHLGLGDEIRTGSQSSADILFSTGQALQLGANGSLVVQGATDAPSAAGPMVVAQTDQLMMVGGASGTSVIGGVRSANDSAEIIAVSPRRAARSLARPVFRWAGGSGELELTVEHAGKVYWKGKVKDTNQLEYPADAPALSGGETYSWRVRSDDPLALGAAESQTAFFTTLNGTQEAELEATLTKVRSVKLADATRAVMAAGVLYDHGLVDEAIQEIDVALAAGGETEGLTAVRENLRGSVWP